MGAIQLAGDGRLARVRRGRDPARAQPVGDAVRVKLEAFPFQQFGTLEGRLDVLSPDSVPVKQGERTNVVFHAEVHLKETAGSVAGLGIRLRPGLVATAEIKAGERSIASYVLDPVVQTFDESLREP